MDCKYGWMCLAYSGRRYFIAVCGCVCKVMVVKYSKTRDDSGLVPGKYNIL